MESFTVRDLREHTGDLIRGAEQGHISLVTKRGHPVFLAVPFSEQLLQEGVNANMAINLFADKNVSLGQAARLANLAISEMIDLLALHGVPVVDYSGEELTHEVSSFT